MSWNASREVRRPTKLPFLGESSSIIELPFYAEKIVIRKYLEEINR